MAFLKSKQTNFFFFFGEVRRINSKDLLNFLLGIKRKENGRDYFETYFVDLCQLYIERMLKIHRSR